MERLGPEGREDAERRVGRVGRVGQEANTGPPVPPALPDLPDPPALIGLFRQGNPKALGHAVQRAAIDAHHLGRASTVVAHLLQHVE
jgi:hypothetical protein